jgi:Na+-driven multidrug efflux pump
MSKNNSPEKSSKFVKRTKQFIRKEITIGVLVSILATASGVFLYLQYFSKYGFDETVRMIQEGNLYASVLALAALPNLFVFFIFIKKKQDYRARGVLMASIFTALITFVLKFI